MPEDYSVDFLKKKYNLAPKRSIRKKRNRGLQFGIATFLSLAIVGILFSHQYAQTSSGEGEHFTLFSPFERLITSNDKSISGENDDRINVLLMGIGGGSHDGPELTDTLILASFKPSTNEASMLSIPRDLVVPIPGYGWRKVNHANAYGEIDDPGSGPEQTVSILEEILDQEIQYHVKIDFSSFEEVIDAIGGVDVYVDRTFTDPLYPAANDLTQSLTFEEGWQHMNGETALQYARSRHGNNGEGSDFARAARQQKVITAAKDKILSSSTLFNPARLNSIAQLFNRHVETNLSIWEMVRLAKFAPELSNDNMNHFVLDDAPGSPLYSSTINGAYVLLPKQDDWSDLQYLAANMFSDEDLDFSSARSLEPPEQEIYVEIQNGTFVTGLAGDLADILAASGFNITDISNADSRGYERTIIYDLTEGKKSAELEVLKEFLSADIAQSVEGWLLSPEIVPRELNVDSPSGEEGVDFLIILGQNAQNIVLR